MFYLKRFAELFFMPENQEGFMAEQLSPTNKSEVRVSDLFVYSHLKITIALCETCALIPSHMRI